MKRITMPTNPSLNTLNPSKTMSAVNFLYWLHGAMEMSEKKCFSAKQVEMIKAHLKLVKDNPSLTGWFEGFLATQTKTIRGEAYLLLERKIDENFTKLSQFSLGELGEILKRGSSSPWLDTHIIC